MDIIQLLKQYHKEKRKWKQADKPMRSKERMKELYSICSICPHFRKGKGMMSGYDQCGKCSCNLHPEKEEMNKLSWATTNCPDDPPRWAADYPVRQPERSISDVK